MRNHDIISRQISNQCQIMWYSLPLIIKVDNIFSNNKYKDLIFRVVYLITNVIFSNNKYNNKCYLEIISWSQ